MGPNGPLFGCVNALINPPPALAWRSFLANLQENGFKNTPLGWIVFVVGWRWGSPEGTSGPFCAHELLHTNFVHKRCTNRFVLCTNRFLGPFRIFWRSHPRRGLVILFCFFFLLKLKKALRPPELKLPFRRWQVKKKFPVLNVPRHGALRMMQAALSVSEAWRFENDASRPFS